MSEPIPFLGWFNPEDWPDEQSLGESIASSFSDQNAPISLPDSEDQSGLTEPPGL